MKKTLLASPSLLMVLMTTTFTLTACGGGAPGPEAAAPATPIGTTAPAQDPAVVEAETTADLAAREQELAEREAAFAAQQKAIEDELARRNAENDAAAKAAAEQAAKARAKAPVKAAAATTAAATTAKPKAPPTPIVVPAGTSIAVKLNSAVGTRGALVGDAVSGTLASDVRVGDRVAAKAGSTVRGSVTDVVSGTKKVGGIPKLGIRFTSLVAANGSTMPISASYLQQGVSETGKDTAKIVGGTAAGAVIGHQVDSDKGAVIGGILGAAGGTAAAHKTGGDVKLEAGSVVNVSLESSFQVD